MELWQKRLNHEKVCRDALVLCGNPKPSKPDPEGGYIPVKINKFDGKIFFSHLKEHGHTSMDFNHCSCNDVVVQKKCPTGFHIGAHINKDCNCVSRPKSFPIQTFSEFLTNLKSIGQYIEGDAMYLTHNLTNNAKVQSVYRVAEYVEKNYKDLADTANTMALLYDESKNFTEAAAEKREEAFSLYMKLYHYFRGEM